MIEHEAQDELRSNMKNRTPLSNKVRSSRWQNQQGITLVTTLLLLVLLMGMSLTMVLAVSSESLINGYYGRYRGSFYAADSGVAAARQQIMNNLSADIPPGFNPATGPIANTTTAGTAAQTAITAAFGGFTPVNTANSWQERFKITNVAVPAPNTTITCTPIGGTTTNCAAPGATVASPVTGYKYSFPYSVTVIGQSQGSEVATLVDSGTIFLNASVTAASYNQSFAAWGMFIGTYALCSGDLVPGTITGPVFTNGSWNFSNSGPYTFTDPVGQSGSQAGWDNGSCTASATPTNGIHPTFTGGFNVSQPSVSLPTDSFNQEQAVLDGIGIASGNPTNAQLSAALKNAAGTAYPSGGAASGVYLPYSINASTGAKTFTGGGIFVQGNATVKLTPASGSNTAQVYTIVNNGVTTTITIDPAAGSAGTTTINTAGVGTQTINGVPQQMSSSGLSIGDATMLFVNGNITGLSGPGQGQAAIQNGTALSIVASGSNNITVTGDILYKTEPVTMTGTPTSTPPIDQLIPANNTGQVLGLFTAGGNVYLNNSQSNGNLEIDASIATISATGSGAIINNGAGINTLTIVGGRIQNTIQNINTTTRNVLFDRRFLSGGFAPPWFPSTTITPGAGVGGTVTATWKGTQWLNQTNYQ
jgi:Tfp pilus assembly protein PilX